MSVQATFTLELDAYIDVFDLLDYLQPHVQKPIIWHVEGVHGDQPTEPKPRTKAQAKIDEVIAQADEVAENGYDTETTYTPDPVMAEVNEIINVAKAEQRRARGSGSMRLADAGRNIVKATTPGPTADAATERLKAKQKQLQRERLLEHISEAQKISTLDRAADVAAIEREMDRPDLAHLSRSERRAIIRVERKSKRQAIKRAMEAERNRMVIAWIGQGNEQDGESAVLGVTCPFCEAPPDAACRTSSGYEYVNTFHIDRFRAAAEVLGLDYDEFSNQVWEQQARYRRALELLRQRR